MAETADIFVIDGEDAGTTPWEWDSLVEEAGNTVTLSAANPAHGSYSYEIAFGGSNDRVYATVSFTELTEIYFRFYFEFNQFSADTGEIRLLYLSDIGVNACGFLYLQGTGAGNGIGYTLLHRDNTGLRTAVDHSADEIFFPNTRYWIDIHWVQGSSNDGGIEMLLNGVAQGGETNRTNDDFTPDALWVGNIYAPWNPANGTKYYIDDFLAATTGWIGAYPSPSSAERIVRGGLIDPRWFKLVRK